MASMAVSTVGKPVMRITMISASVAFAILRTSSPPIPGIFKSVITTSRAEVRRISSATFPEEALTTSYPPPESVSA